MKINFKKLNKALEDYKNNIEVYKICKKYKISSSTLFKYIKLNNITFRSIKGNFNNRKHFFNEYYFNDINIPEKAYWLGFMYADGFISNNRNSVGLALQTKDKGHLIKLKKALDAKTTKIKKEVLFNVKLNDRIYKKTSCVKIYFYSGILWKSLDKQGCFNKKSLILKFPTKEQVPKEFIRYFIRGFIDGDGSISYSKADGKNQYRVELCGPKLFLENVMDILHKETGVFKTKIIKQKNIYRFKFGGNNNIRKLMDYLCKDMPVFLDRKQEIYKQYLTEKITVWGGDDDCRAKRYEFLKENGELLVINNLRKFCKENTRYNRSSLMRLFKGQVNKYKDLLYLNKENKNHE